jgi:hypothetical protein
MARTLEEIQQQLVDALNASQQLAPLEALTTDELQQTPPTSNSRVAQWRKLLHAVATCIYFLEVLMDEFYKRVEERIASQRVSKISWYQEQALRFQFGATTDANGYYDNSNRTTAEVEAMRVFKFAAITRTIQQGQIIMRCKVAGLNNGVLVAVTPQQLAAGQAFITENTPAGTNTIVTTGPGDLLKLELDIYFNPQVLDTDGKRLDGTNDTPVIDATEQFLKDITFNDSYVRAYHTDALQTVEGVRIPVVRFAASRYGIHQYNSTGIANAGVIDQLRVADSGYFIIDEAELVINYIPYE